MPANFSKWLSLLKREPAGRAGAAKSDTVRVKSIRQKSAIGK